jgi:hypothetical protein
VKTILKILGPTETKRRRKNYRYYCSLDSAAAAMWMFVVYGLTSISMLVIDNKFTICGVDALSWMIYVGCGCLVGNDMIIWDVDTCR